jgi:hypothetical protein
MPAAINRFSKSFSCHPGRLEMASSLAPWRRAMLLVEAAKQQGLQPNMATVAGQR